MIQGLGENYLGLRTLHCFLEVLQELGKIQNDFSQRELELGFVGHWFGRRNVQ